METKLTFVKLCEKILGEEAPLYAGQKKAAERKEDPEFVKKFLDFLSKKNFVVDAERSSASLSIENVIVSFSFKLEEPKLFVEVTIFMAAGPGGEKAKISTSGTSYEDGSKYMINLKTERYDADYEEDLESCLKKILEFGDDAVLGTKRSLVKVAREAITSKIDAE